MKIMHPGASGVDSE